MILVIALICNVNFEDGNLVKYMTDDDKSLAFYGINDDYTIHVFFPLF